MSGNRRVTALPPRYRACRTTPPKDTDPQEGATTWKTQRLTRSPQHDEGGSTSAARHRSQQCLLALPSSWRPAEEAPTRDLPPLARRGRRDPLARHRLERSRSPSVCARTGFRTSQTPKTATSSSAAATRTTRTSNPQSRPASTSCQAGRPPTAAEADRTARPNWRSPTACRPTGCRASRIHPATERWGSPRALMQTRLSSNPPSRHAVRSCRTTAPVSEGELERGPLTNRRRASFVDIPASRASAQASEAPSGRRRFSDRGRGGGGRHLGH
jgi:hypothetical protein